MILAFAELPGVVGASRVWWISHPTFVVLLIGVGVITAAVLFAPTDKPARRAEWLIRAVRGPRRFRRRRR